MSGAEDRSDRELIRLVCEGNPDGFAQLSARYLPLLRSRAAQFAGPSAPEREDLLQEGFFALYAAAISYDETKNASFSTYAGVCVHNRMADCARRHRSGKNRLLNESLSLDSSDAASLSAGKGPEELLELREQLQGLFQSLGQTLSPSERRALTLYLSGCKREEVRERSGMELKAFDNAMYRVRKKLKKFR